jgi:rubrerythrin
MLSGKGFRTIINLSGGIKAWNGEKAFYGEEKGLELFDGKELPEQTLIVAYALEAGLCEFYVSMLEKLTDAEIRNLFQKLSRIEAKHQDRIFQQYLQISGGEVSREEFEANQVEKAVEGGLTTEEYIRLFSPDLASEEGVIALAMSIEAQALDLYSRAADRTNNGESEVFLRQMADEEQAHLQQLGELM